MLAARGRIPTLLHLRYRSSIDFDVLLSHLHFVHTIANVSFRNLR